jgi:hypothetical protein
VSCGRIFISSVTCVEAQRSFVCLCVVIRWVVPGVVPQGLFKVLGKGNLPNFPIIVKAKYFSKDAEQKIKEAGGACILTA